MDYHGARSFIFEPLSGLFSPPIRAQRQKELAPVRRPFEVRVVGDFFAGRQVQIHKLTRSSFPDYRFEGVAFHDQKRQSRVASGDHCIPRTWRLAGKSFCALVV
jgi:hypothetical protein